MKTIETKDIFNNLWKVNDKSYYLNINDKLKEITSPLLNHLKFLLDNVKDLEVNSSRLVKNEIKINIEGIIGFIPEEASLPGVGNLDIKRAEEEYKSNILNDVYKPLVTVRNIVKGLKTNDNSIKNRLDEITADIDSIAKTVLKLNLFPERALRARAANYENDRKKLSEAYGTDYEKNSNENNHYAIFFASNRSNPEELEHKVYNSFSNVYNEVLKIKKYTDVTLNSSENSQEISSKVEELQTSLKDFSNDFLTIKSLFRHSGLGNFIKNDFNKSEKILATELILNHLYEEFYVKVDDINSNVKQLEKELSHEQSFSAAAHLQHLRKSLNSTLEVTRNIWGQHSDIAKNVIVFANKQIGSFRQL